MKHKKARGAFDPELAVKAFAYAAQDGLKKYNKEFGPVNLPRGTVGSTMMAVGRELLNQYQEEI